MNQRWRTSLHEAGHAVYDRVAFGNQKGYVYVLDDTVAMCVGDFQRESYGFQDAVMSACGKSAESLADQHAPPEARPKPSEILSPEPSKTSVYQELQQDVATVKHSGESDSRRIAVWCITGYESYPEKWKRRHDIIRREAGAFIANHAEQILVVARRLYVDGIVFLHSLGD